MEMPSPLPILHAMKERLFFLNLVPQCPCLVQRPEPSRDMPQRWRQSVQSQGWARRAPAQPASWRGFACLLHIRYHHPPIEALERSPWGWREVSQWQARGRQAAKPHSPPSFSLQKCRQHFTKKSRLLEFHLHSQKPGKIFLFHALF